MSYCKVNSDLMLEDRAPVFPSLLANEVKIVSRMAVVYYIDNADREVRILEVRRADS